MAEESDAGSPDRRATWFALSTLRQRPTVVGHTSDSVGLARPGCGRRVFPPAGAVRQVRQLTGPAVLTPLLAALDWQREAEGRLAQHRRASQEDAAPASR